MSDGSRSRNLGRTLAPLVRANVGRRENPHPTALDGNRVHRVGEGLFVASTLERRSQRHRLAGFLRDSGHIDRIVVDLEHLNGLRQLDTR